MRCRADIMGRLIFAGLFWAVALSVLGVMYACRSSTSNEIHPAGDSFFPLAEGNRWLFQVPPSRYMRAEPGVPPDTVWIDQVKVFGGKRFYRLRASWLGFYPDGRWVRRDGNGNLLWSEHLGGREYPFLVFDAPIGQTWYTGTNECMDSLSMKDDYAVVNTPYGRFDGVREIGDVTRCMDVGWGVSVARGVGPVRWTQITFGGAIVWDLVDARVHDDASRHLAAEKSRIVNGD